MLMFLLYKSCIKLLKSRFTIGTTENSLLWIFTEGEGDEIESRLPFKIFSTLPNLSLNVKVLGPKWFIPFWSFFLPLRSLWILFNENIFSKLSGLLTWNLARNLRITNAGLYREIRKVLQQSLRVSMQTQAFVRDKGLTVRFHGRRKNEPAHYCGICDEEVFNNLFIKVIILKIFWPSRAPLVD